MHVEHITYHIITQTICGCLKKSIGSPNAFEARTLGNSFVWDFLYQFAKIEQLINRLEL